MNCLHLLSLLAAVAYARHDVFPGQVSPAAPAPATTAYLPPHHSAGSTRGHSAHHHHHHHHHHSSRGKSVRGYSKSARGRPTETKAVTMADEEEEDLSHDEPEGGEDTSAPRKSYTSTRCGRSSSTCKPRPPAPKPAPAPKPCSGSYCKTRPTTRHGRSTHYGRPAATDAAPSNLGRPQGVSSEEEEGEGAPATRRGRTTHTITTVTVTTGRGSGDDASPAPASRPSGVSAQSSGRGNTGSAAGRGGKATEDDDDDEPDAADDDDSADASQDPRPRDPDAADDDSRTVATAAPVNRITAVRPSSDTFYDGEEFAFYNRHKSTCAAIKVVGLRKRIKLVTETCSLGQAFLPRSRFTFHWTPAHDNNLSRLAVFHKGKQLCAHAKISGTYFKPCDAKSMKFSLGATTKRGQFKVRNAARHSKCMDAEFHSQMRFKPCGPFRDQAWEKVHVGFQSAIQRGITA